MNLLRRFTLHCGDYNHIYEVNINSGEIRLVSTFYTGEPIPDYPVFTLISGSSIEDFKENE